MSQSNQRSDPRFLIIPIVILLIAGALIVSKLLPPEMSPWVSSPARDSAHRTAAQRRHPRAARSRPSTPWPSLVAPGVDAKSRAFIERVQTRLLRDKHLTGISADRAEAAVKADTFGDAFDADARSQRVQLGQSLDADVLLMARPSPTHFGMNEWVVSETQHGLRLFVQRLRADQATHGLIAFHRMNEAAIIKLEQPTVESISVAPFVDDRPVPENEKAGAAFAHVFEQALAPDPDVLLITAADGQVMPRKPMTHEKQQPQWHAPLQVVGHIEAAQDAQDAQAGEVTVHITVERNGEPVLQRQSKALSPTEAGGFCEQVAQAFLTDVLNRDTPAKQPTGTIGYQLYRQSRRQEALGALDEALEWIDAALLMQPDDKQTLEQRCSIVQERIEKVYDANFDAPDAYRLREQARDEWVHTLDLLVAWERSHEGETILLNNDVARFVSATSRHMVETLGYTPEVIYKNRRRMREELIASLTRLHDTDFKPANKYTLNYVTNYMGSPTEFDEPRIANDEVRVRLAKVLRGYPQDSGRIYHLLYDRLIEAGWRDGFFERRRADGRARPVGYGAGRGTRRTRGEDASGAWSAKRKRARQRAAPHPPIRSSASNQCRSSLKILRPARSGRWHRGVGSQAAMWKCPGRPARCT